MERELGLSLFRRVARGVEVTTAGSSLYVEAKKLLSQFDHALETTRRAARGEIGSLHIGIAPTAPFHPLVPRSIRSFRESYPQVGLTLEEGLSNEIASRFKAGQMDIAFVRATQVHADDVIVAALHEEPMVMALPSGHALAKRTKTSGISLKDLATDAFVLIGPPGTGLHDETMAACRAAGFLPKIAQPAPRITSTLGLVAAGLGISLVPATMQSVQVDGVTYRTLRDVAPKAFLGLAWQRSNQSPALANFAKLVRTKAREKLTF